ncbi:MAG: hypothetical protein Q7T74_01575, partial [Candidatus Saccharibacteria bacterium]|nr:hypothetical protein [Candidatus Saccharibacteria bacterium]
DKLLGVDYTAPYSVFWTATETGRDYLHAQAEGTNEGTAVSGMYIVEVLTSEDYTNGAASSTSRSSPSSSNFSVASISSHSFSSSGQSLLVPQIALFTPEPGKASKTYLGDEAMLFAAVYDQDLRPWKNQNGSSPRIEYYINNQLITDLRSDTASGIKYWKPSALGNYGIKATAYLDDQTLTTSVGVISVVKPLPPSITLGVAQGAKLYAGSLASVVAKVVDPDKQTKEVKFFANGEQISLPDFAEPYEGGWIPTLPGSYKLEAELLDKSGNIVRSPVTTLAVEPATLPDFDGVRGVSNYGDAQLQGLKWTPLNHSDVLVSKIPNAGKISYNKLT